MSSTVTIAFVSVCSGQGHVTVDVTPQGQSTKRLTYEVADLRDTPDWSDQFYNIIRGLIQLHMRGLTQNQAKAEMQAGFTLTI